MEKDRIMQSLFLYSRLNLRLCGNLSLSNNLTKHTLTAFDKLFASPAFIITH